MKKTVKFLATAMAVCAFAACNNDEMVPNPDQSGKGAKVSISLKNPENTRADGGTENGTAAESAINTLNFYVFKSDGTLDVQKEFTAAQSNYVFVVNNPGASMKFLVAINQTMADMTGKTFDEVCEVLSQATTLTGFEKPATEGNSLTAPTSFAMSGWTVANVTASAGEDSPVTPVAINVSRLVSKVEAPAQASPFGMDIPVSDLKALFGDDDVTSATFNMEGWALINGINKTDAFYTWNTKGDDLSTWDTWVRTGKSYFSSEFDANGTYERVYAGTTAGDMFLTDAAKVMYIYENMPADDAAEPTLFFDRTTVYSFIIKGTLTSVNPNGAATVTRYWRANLIPDENHRVLRNAIYRMTLEGVETVGYDTPEDAEDEVVPKNGNASVRITLTVNPWRIRTSSITL